MRGVRAYYINVPQTVSVVLVWAGNLLYWVSLLYEFWRVSLFGGVYQPQPKVSLEEPLKVCTHPPGKGQAIVHPLMVATQLDKKWNIGACGQTGTRSGNRYFYVLGVYGKRTRA